MKNNKGTRITALIFSIFAHSSLLLVVATAGFEMGKKQSRIPVEIKTTENDTTLVDSKPVAAPAPIKEVTALPKSLPEKAEAKAEPVINVAKASPKKVEAKPVKKIAPKKIAIMPTVLPSKKTEQAEEKPVVPLAKLRDDTGDVAQKTEVIDDKAVEPKEEPAQVEEKADEQAKVDVLPKVEEQPKVDEKTDEQAKVEEQPKVEEKSEPEVAQQPEEKTVPALVDPQQDLQQKADDEQATTEAAAPQKAAKDDGDDWTKELQAATIPMAQASPPSKNAQPGQGAGFGNQQVRSESELSPIKGNPQATYPQAARLKHVQGTAIVRFNVDGKGNVTDAWLQSSSGFKAIDEEALKTQKSWKYRAGKTGLFQKQWVFKLTGDAEEMPYKFN